MGAAGHQGERPVRPGRGAPHGLPRRPGDGLRRGQLDRADRARRQGQPQGLLRLPVRQADPGRAAAQPLHHPAGQHRARHPQAGVHQQVRLPRRRTRGARLPDIAHARRGLRGQARGEPARALREDPGGLVREPGRALGRGGRGGRPGHGPGVAAVHGGLAARVRHQPHRAAPGARRPAALGRDIRHAAPARLGGRADSRLLIPNERWFSPRDPDSGHRGAVRPAPPPACAGWSGGPAGPRARVPP